MQTAGEISTVKYPQNKIFVRALSMRERFNVGVREYTQDTYDGHGPRQRVQKNHGPDGRTLNEQYESAT